MAIFTLFSAVIYLRRQNLTSKNVRFWRLKWIPALKELIHHVCSLWNMTTWNNVVLMLGQRRRRWPSIKTALAQRLVFTGRWELNPDQLGLPTWQPVCQSHLHTAIRRIVSFVFADNRPFCGLSNDPSLYATLTSVARHIISGFNTCIKYLCLFPLQVIKYFETHTLK